MIFTEPEPEPEPDSNQVILPGRREICIYFEFEKLDVYQISLDFVVVADEITESLPRGRSYLKDQLRRAANSIPANLAEGVGEFSPPDKLRFFRMSRRSAVECASHLLVCRRLRLADDTLVDKGLGYLHRIVAMLTSLVKSVSTRSEEDR